jgi:putative addiction module killer protein
MVDTILPMRHPCMMIEIVECNVFTEWFDGLRDGEAKSRILVRIRRLGLGNPGDVKPVGQGISEMRINYGPGYRLYFQQRGAHLVILLCGGDKSTQGADIAKAKDIAHYWED